MGFLLPLPPPHKNSRWYNEIKFDDDEIPAFTRMIFDAAKVYALVGNDEGLEFCRRLASLLILGHPKNATLHAIIDLHPRTVREGRLQAESN